MNIPPPPPRVIEPAPEPMPEPVGDLPPLPPSAPPARKPAPKEAPAKEPAKVEPLKPVEPPPVETPPKETPKPPPDPAVQLRTPQTADTSGAAKNVQATIDSATGMLNTVNFGTLSNERKKAYNDAKLWLQQAEDALKQGNLVFAQGVATKAETLAKQLAGK